MFFRFVTKHACDGRTDRHTDGQNYDPQDRTSIVACHGENCLEKVQKGETRMVKRFKKLPYATRLKKLGIYSLDRRRLCGDLIETFKMITGKEHVNSSKFCSAVRCHEWTQCTLTETVQAKMPYSNQTELLFITCHQ